MSEPALCEACRTIGDDMDWSDCHAVQDRIKMQRGELTCRDELELYRDGIHAERARVRALLAANAERMRTFDGYVLPSKALDAILGGEDRFWGWEIGFEVSRRGENVVLRFFAGPRERGER